MKKESKKSVSNCKKTKRGNKSLILLLLVYMLLLSTTSINAQQIIPGILYLNALTDDAKPGTNRIVQNETLFSIFQQYNVSSYVQSMPYAKTPYLWNVYRIECSGDVEALKIALEEQAGKLVTDLMFVYQPEFNYQPEDQYWGNGNLWHLKKIQADSAWDLT